MRDSASWCIAKGQVKPLRIRVTFDYRQRFDAFTLHQHRECRISLLGGRTEVLETTMEWNYVLFSIIQRLHTIILAQIFIFRPAILHRWSAVLGEPGCSYTVRGCDKNIYLGRFTTKSPVSCLRSRLRLGVYPTTYTDLLLPRVLYRIIDVRNLLSG